MVAPPRAFLSPRPMRSRLAYRWAIWGPSIASPDAWYRRCTMAQNRDAPAFQEYAAAMMARTDYRVMSLEARGLLYTLRLECWVNGSLPGDPVLLARVLGYSAEQVQRALPELSRLFGFEGGEIRCPELDNYRAHLEERRQRQSEGGKAGAAKTNSRRGRPIPGDPPGKARVPRDSLVKNSPIQQSKENRLESEPVLDPWVNEYERASNGG